MIEACQSSETCFNVKRSESDYYSFNSSEFDGATKTTLCTTSDCKPISGKLLNKFFKIGKLILIEINVRKIIIM